MKQKFTLTVAILTLIELICLCIPSSIVETTYVKEGHFYVPTYTHSRNIFGVWTSTGKTLGFLLAILLFFSFVAFLLNYLHKNPISKITPWLSVASAIMLGIYGLYAGVFADVRDAYFSNSWDLGWLFYVAILLHAVCVLLAILIRFKKDDAPKTPAEKLEQ